MTEVIAADEILARAGSVSRIMQGKSADREYPTEDMQALKAHGLHALWIPRAHGGWQAPLRVINHVFLELAKANSSTAQIFQVHTTHCHVVALLGSPEQQQRFFHEVLEEGCGSASAATNRARTSPTGRRGSPEFPVATG